MEETEILELKKSTSELKESIISIASILNKHSKGEIYFGIKNNGDIVGQDVSERTLREISKAISDNIEPKIFPHIKKIILNGKTCINVKFNGEDKPYYAFGRAYIRVADEDRQLTAKEIERLILSKNKVRWDLQACNNATLRDIDKKSIINFIKLVQKSRRVDIETKDIPLILRKLELMKDEKLTNAAILLFGNKPSRFFGNAIVKCGRFRGVTKEEFIDMKDYEGNLFFCLEKSLDFLKEHMRLSAKIKGLLRVEKWEFPEEALREAVINALIHRDYTSNSFTYIKFYDDSIVIANPGRLPDILKINDLYREHESVPTNPLLAKIFFYAGYIDAWGRGITNIVQFMHAEELGKPLFEESGGSFRIIFNRNLIEKVPEKLGVKLGVNEKMAIGLISDNKYITIKELSKKLGISEIAVYKNITKLKEKGLLKRIGSDKSGYWEIINATEKLGLKLDIKLGVNEERIINLISDNRYTTIRELSKKLGISEIAVYKNITKLKEKGLLKRIGSDKNGYWEIISIDSQMEKTENSRLP